MSQDKGGRVTVDGKAPEAAPAGLPERAEAATAARGARRLVVVDVMFPTDPKAVARLKRGDSVPWDECGWVSARAGSMLDTSALDPFVVSSLAKQGAFGALAMAGGE